MSPTVTRPLFEPAWRPDRRWGGLRLHAQPADAPAVADALAGNALLATLPVLADVSLLSVAPSDWLLVQPAGLAVPAGAAVMPDYERVADCPVNSPSFVGRVHQPGDFAQLPPAAWCCGAWPLAASARGSKPRPTQPVLLELLGLIVRDADSPEMESVFAKAPQLSVSLLRLVNSVGVSGTLEAGSLREAITLLGRRQLQRWLQLLLYAEQFGPGERIQPLLVVAALRARRLENWASAGWLGDTPAESAFFTGMLSCLDCLFGMPMSDLISPLPLPHAVAAALIDGDGPLGEGLHRLDRLEHGVPSAFAGWPAHATDNEWLASEIDALAWTRKLLAGSAAA